MNRWLIVCFQGTCKTAVLLLLLCFWNSSQAQNYSITNYRIDDGIPSNEIFSVVQDSTGYIWFATDKGISRFDGHTFKNFGFDEGLLNPVCYKLIALENDILAFQSSDNSIGLIKNNEINYIKPASTLEIQSIYNWHNDVLVAYSDSCKYEVFDCNGKCLISKRIKSSGTIVYFDSSLTAAVGLFNYYPSSFQYYRNETLTTHDFGSKYLSEKWNPNSWINYKKKSYFINGKSIFILSDTILPIKRLDVIASSGSAATSSNQLWVGLLKGGVQVFDNDSFKKSKTYLMGSSVSSIIEDNKGNIWCSTLENGLFKFNSTYFTNILTGSVNNLTLKSDTIIVTNNDSNVLFIDHQFSLIKEYEINDLITDIQVKDHEVIIKALHHFSGNPKTISGNVLQIGGSSKGTIWKNQVMGFFRNNLYRMIPHVLYGRVKNLECSYTYVAKTFNDTMVVGTNGGLYKVFMVDSTFFSTKVLDEIVTEIAQTKYGYALGTKGKGLILTNQSFDKQKHFTTKSGLSGNFITDISNRSDTLLISTSDGLNMMSLSESDEVGRIISVGKQDGLLSRHINEAHFIGNSIIIASNGGLQSILISRLTPKKDNPISTFEYINQKDINGKKQTIKAGTRNISIGINTILFNSSINPIIEFRLLGSDTNWVKTYSKELEFSNLSPGDYTLQLKSRLPRNDHSSLAQMNFTIEPTLLQSPWFRLTIFLAILVLIFCFVKWREKQTERRNLNRLNHEKLRFATLTSQLNPHFMFNALGSIQSLILTKKNEQAAENLAGFSGLLDKILSNTNELFIPLNKEIDFINEYIKMEQSRFLKPFAFSWSLDSIHPSNTLVPSMFLQPFIENAILHGINNIDHAGKIEVEMKIISTQVLEIIIKDNGIGILAAKKLNTNRERKSMAMKNLESRLKIMEKLYSANFSQSLSPLYDDTGKLCGTKAILDIPYKLKI